MFAEIFVAWRYLHRRRSSTVVRALTLFFLVALVATEVAVFRYGHVSLGALLTLPLAIPFCFFLLLNVFSVLTTVSIFGVILGVAALTVVMSVTSGFQQTFRDRVFGVNAHVLALKYGQ